jgi:putative oxidoreductase
MITAVVLLLGRVLLAFIFLFTGLAHLAPKDPGVGYAKASGVPVPQLSVRLAGLLALTGGLSILFGFHARVGAWLLVLFLVPVTLAMHRYWHIKDPAAAAMQRVQFVKNAALLGAALMIANLGSGLLSLTR